MKMVSIVIVGLLAAIGFLNVSVYAIETYIKWKDSRLIYIASGGPIIKVAAEDNVGQVILDGNKSMIIYKNGDTPIDIKIPGKKTPVVIKNFFAVNYYPTIISRWNATKSALNMIWRGERGY